MDFLATAFLAKERQRELLETARQAHVVATLLEERRAHARAGSAQPGGAGSRRPRGLHGRRLTLLPRLARG